MCKAGRGGTIVVGRCGRTGDVQVKGTDVSAIPIDINIVITPQDSGETEIRIVSGAKSEIIVLATDAGVDSTCCRFEVNAEFRIIRGIAKIYCGDVTRAGKDVPDSGRVDRGTAGYPRVGLTGGARTDGRAGVGISAGNRDRIGAEIIGRRLQHTNIK